MSNPFLQGVQIGGDAVGDGFQAYERAEAKKLAAKLREGAQANADREHKYKMNKDASDASEKNYDNMRLDAKQLSDEKHARKQDELIQASIDAMKQGRTKSGGLPGGSTARVPPEIQVAMKNREDKRKAITPYLMSGKSVPDNVLNDYNESEAALVRVAKDNKFNLGMDDSPEPLPAPVAAQKSSMWGDFKTALFGGSKPSGGGLPGLK